MDVAAQLKQGVVPAGILRERLGVSSATLMRAVRERRADILPIGRSRATRYGLREVWPGSAVSTFPIVRVAEDGSPHSIGELYTLAARETVWMPRGQVSRRLPVELGDARPAGFLGRHFAALHADLPLPSRL